MSKIIDVHSHFVTKEYLDMVARHGASMEDGFPLPTWSPEEQLKLMDDCGISWTLISLSSPQPYFVGADEEAIQMCRSLNDYAAEVKTKYPDRFGFNAPDLTLEQFQDIL